MSIKNFQVDFIGSGNENYETELIKLFENVMLKIKLIFGDL